MVEPLNTNAWVMAPIDPTTEMIGAATRVDFDNEDEVAMTINLWHAMVSASPALPAVDGGELAAFLKERDGQEFDGEVHLTSAEAAFIAALISSQKQSIDALMSERTSLIETKREQLAQMQVDTTRAEWRAVNAESRVQSLEEEVKVLREALKPFGEYAPYVDMFVKGRAAQGGSPLLPTKHFRLSHFQAARTALKENGNG